MTADDENHVLQDIVRQNLYAQNPAELTKRRNREVDLITWRTSNGQPSKPSKRAAAAATQAGRRPVVNKLEAQPGGNADMERGDKHGVHDADEQNQRPRKLGGTLIMNVSD